MHQLVSFADGKHIRVMLLDLSNIALILSEVVPSHALSVLLATNTLPIRHSFNHAPDDTACFLCLISLTALSPGNVTLSSPHSAKAVRSLKASQTLNH